MRLPTNPFHPGEILLEEFLTPMGMTQSAFAERLGWTRTRLNELIKGKRGITADAALDLAQALNTKAMDELASHLGSCPGRQTKGSRIEHSSSRNLQLTASRHADRYTLYVTPHE